jgi:hypothetical protein
MSISQQSHTESQRFMDTIHLISGIIEKWAPEHQEQEYIEAMNALMAVCQYQPTPALPTPTFTQVLTTQPIVATHTHRVAMKIRQVPEETTDAQKIKEGTHLRCGVCDRIVKTDYIGKHQFNKVCRDIKSSKKIQGDISHKSGEQDKPVSTTPDIVLNCIATIKSALYKSQEGWTYPVAWETDDDGKTTVSEWSLNANRYSKYCGDMLKDKTVYVEVVVEEETKE